MKTIALFLYFADVADNLLSISRHLLGPTLFITIVFLSLMIIGFVNIKTIEDYKNQNEDFENPNSYWSKYKSHDILRSYKDNILFIRLFEMSKKVLRLTLTVAVISMLVSIFVPKPKTIYMISGALVTNEILSNEEVRKTGGKVMDLINKKLDDLTKDDVKKEDKNENNK